MNPQAQDYFMTYLPYGQLRQKSQLPQNNSVLKGFKARPRRRGRDLSESFANLPSPTVAFLPPERSL